MTHKTHCLKNAEYNCKQLQQGGLQLWSGWGTDLDVLMIAGQLGVQLNTLEYDPLPVKLSPTASAWLERLWDRIINHFIEGDLPLVGRVSKLVGTTLSAQADKRSSCQRPSCLRMRRPSS
jgi:hypothetical protein